MATRTPRKKVFIALRMAGIAGQEKLAGIFRFLGSDHDWDVTLVRTAAEFTPQRMRRALAAHYNGFIVSIPDTEKTAALLADSNVPTIVMDIHDPALSARRKNIVFIRNDPEAIGRSAADFLLSTGRCRSYAFVQNPSVAEWSVDRFRHFKKSLLDRGFWCHELATPKELAKLERPVGVFTANDDCGYDTLEYCRAHRIRVPEDMLVIGTNNDTLICENCRPSLSSIQPDFNEEGFLAARELDRMMFARTNGQTIRQSDNPANIQKSNNQTIKQSSNIRKSNNQTIQQSNNPTILSVGVKTVVRRESTAEVSQAGKLVQKAVAYIRKNALRGISVRDVVGHLGCSRRLADLRFRELQGESMGEAIIALRLNEVKRLLKSTHDPIDKIAADCGYQNPNYLKNLFKKRFGQTMREWRRQ